MQGVQLVVMMHILVSGIIKMIAFIKYTQCTVQHEIIKIKSNNGNFHKDLIFIIFASDLKAWKYVSLEKLYFLKKSLDVAIL